MDRLDPRIFGGGQFKARLGGIDLEKV